MTELASRLEGSWRLSTYTEADQDGVITLPVGPEPAGSIVYASDGRMSAQIMSKSWSPGAANAADAYYVAYSGVYLVDEAQYLVEHHIEISAIPGWLGTVQRRTVSFDAQGRLTLASVAPIQTTSGSMSAHLTWSRYPDLTVTSAPLERL